MPLAAGARRAPQHRSLVRARGRVSRPCARRVRPPERRHRTRPAAVARGPRTERCRRGARSRWWAAALARRLQGGPGVDTLWEMRGGSAPGGRPSGGVAGCSAPFAGSGLCGRVSPYMPPTVPFFRVRPPTAPPKPPRDRVPGRSPASRWPQDPFSLTQPSSNVAAPASTISRPRRCPEALHRDASLLPQPPASPVASRVPLSGCRAFHAGRPSVPPAAYAVDPLHPWGYP